MNFKKWNRIMIKKHFSLDSTRTIFFLALLVTLPMLFQYIPSNDCAARYAPMAEAFAAGDFGMAFHSRFLPLYTILTGSICFIFKCSGYFACKFVCWLLFSFSVYPIFYLVKFVSDKKKIALISSFLFIFCYPLMAFTGGGTRANLKSFLIVWLAWAFIGSWKYGKFKYLLCCSVFAAFLTLTRGDSALYAILVLGTLIIKEMFSAKVKFIYKPVIAGLLFLTILSPWLYFQYYNIGYPVPETRHAMLLDRMSKAIPYIKLLHNEKSKFNIVTGNINAISDKKSVSLDYKTSKRQIVNKKVSIVLSYHASKDTPYQMFIKFIKCFFPFYMIFALTGIILRLKEKLWNKFDTILLSLFFGHTFLMIAQVLIADHKLYVSQRYILTAIPLYLIWVATAFLYIYEKFKGLWNGKFKYLLFLACLVGMIILYQQGTKKIFRENCSKREWLTDMRTISKIINEQNLLHISGEHTPMRCNFNTFPLIMTNEAAIGYYAKCKVISLKCAKQNPEATNKLIKEGRIQFIAIRHKYAKRFPALNDKSQIKELYKGGKYSLWSLYFLK